MNYGTPNKVRINEVLAYMKRHSDEFHIREPNCCVMGMIFRAAKEYRWAGDLSMPSLCLLGVPLSTYDRINHDIIMPEGWLDDDDDAAVVYTYDRAVRMLERYRDHGVLSWEGV